MSSARSAPFRTFCLLAASAIPLVAAAPAFAGDSRKVDGASFPDTLAVGATTLKLNGVGVRVFYHLVDGYATALYVPATSHSADALVNGPNPKVIFTQFLHEASSSRIHGEYDAIHARYCKVNSCDPANEQAYAKFLAGQTGAAKGETQTILITDQGVSVQRGGKEITKVESPGFGQSLVKSLVGPAAPTEAYRNGILGISD